MKDLKLIKTSYTYFDDVSFSVIDDKVVFDTVSNEERIVQTLTKIVLTPYESHIFEYGVDHANFNEYEIDRALNLYSNIESNNPREEIDYAQIIKLDENEYIVDLITKEKTQLKLKLGI